MDFSEEEVNFANKDQLKDLLSTLHNDIHMLKESFIYGNVIKNGVPVAIAGKPNAGKSSLLNTLLNEEKAIVSNIPGTTRDVIEDTLTIGGITFRFIDTAGLRETNDVIEAMGVKKAREKITQASILIYLYERTTAFKDLISEIKSLQHKNQNLILIENKIDQYSEGFDNNLNNELLSALDSKEHALGMGISTLTSESIAPLKAHLVNAVKEMGDNAAIVVNNSRHYHALINAFKAIEITMDGLENDIPGDLLSIELKEAIFYIGSITGKIDTDQDVLGAIFGQFCIGK